MRHADSRRFESPARPGAIRVIVLAIMSAFFGEPQAGSSPYHPIDSSDTYLYMQCNWTLGSNLSSDTSYLEISGQKRLDDSTFTRVVRIDSAGVHATFADTCKERPRAIFCKQETLHIPSSTSALWPDWTVRSLSEGSYFLFDSGSVAGGYVGGRNKEYYQHDVGLIYSFRNRLYGIGESQTERLLIARNSTSVDYRSTVESLGIVAPTMADKSRRSGKIARDGGVLNTKTDILGRHAPSSFFGYLKGPDRRRR